MSGGYAGESIAKKIARVRLYRRAAYVLREIRSGPHEGDHVVLAGPGASEVGCLKHILRVQPERCLFVDYSLVGLAEAERKWPGVRTYDGNIADALREAGARGRLFRFVHLDFLGHLRMETMESIRQANIHLTEKAVVALTFLRGRESGKTPLWREINEVAPQMHEVMRRLADSQRSAVSDAITALDPVRMDGYLMSLTGFFYPEMLEAWRAAIEGRPSLFNRREPGGRPLTDPESGGMAPIFGAKYDSGRSPMGVIAVVRMLVGDLRRPKNAKMLFQAPPSEVAYTIREKSMSELVGVAVLLEAQYGREAACEILDITPGTLAAWKAHHTRGSYGGLRGWW